MLKLAVPRSTPYFPSYWTEKQTKPHHFFWHRPALQPHPSPVMRDMSEQPSSGSLTRVMCWVPDRRLSYEGLLARKR